MEKRKQPKICRSYPRQKVYKSGRISLQDIGKEGLYTETAFSSIKRNF
jgi:hypothetical protein